MKTLFLIVDNGPSLWQETPVIVALIAAAVSLIVAFFNNLNSKKNTERIEILKAELAQEKSEKDARRQYEFEARKKLYQEYEPLLFQLIEASDDALHRIKSLARTAKHGNLNKDGWLSGFEYYTKSTLYKLFVPLALYKIMQKKLTLVDLTLDADLELRYKLAKQIYISYTDDFEFARTYKKVVYDPNHKNWETERENDPVTYWRQGLPMGLLDIVLDILIEKSSDNKERVISYGEFEKKLISSQNNDIDLSRDIFLDFHPAKRPVLWRILITQAQIFKVLISLQKQQNSVDSVRKLLLYERKESIAEFNWKDFGEVDSEIEEPFLVANEYLEKRF